MADALESYRSAGFPSLPVDLAAIAEGYGVQVLVRGDLPEPVAGFLYPGPCWSALVVNGLHPGVRRRLTVAHELAHWCLGDRDFRASRYLDDEGFPRCEAGKGRAAEREQAVNALAAELLMPEVSIRLEWQRCPRVGVLCDRFGVPQALMERRLVELRLLSP